MVIALKCNVVYMYLRWSRASKPFKNKL